MNGSTGLQPTAMQQAGGQHGTHLCGRPPPCWGRWRQARVPSPSSAARVRAVNSHCHGKLRAKRCAACAVCSTVFFACDPLRLTAASLGAVPCCCCWERADGRLCRHRVMLSRM